MTVFLDDALFTLTWPLPILIIAAGMTFIALAAYLKKALDSGGASGAWIMGVIVLWTLRFEGFFVFLLFFVSCTVVGKISGKIRKNQKGDVEGKKGHRRDFMQVLANGLMTTIAACIWWVSGKNAALIMFGAAVAEATSDTFAGEIGRLSKKPPVSIRTFRPVPVGLSGGITVLGTFAAFVSSAVIALAWFLLFQGASFHGAALVCLMGFAGAVLDSWLGASVQAHYIDPDTGGLTEHEEKNGMKLELSRGIRWVDNDMVNLMSNVFSSVFAFGMAALIL